MKKKIKKIKRKLTEGIVNIKSSYNNTMVNVTDLQGNVIAWQSAGTIGFKGTKKSTPYAAKLVTEKCLTIVKPTGITKVIIKTNGIGPGKASAIKTIQEMGFEITLVKDVTPTPFNGCKLKKGKRK